MNLSLFFWGYVSWIVEASRKLGIRRLYFFTREGEFFKKLYDEFGKSSLNCKKVPDAKIIEVSRMSTFFPSLREISTEECKRIWNQYTAQSMDAFCRSLHIDIRLIEKMLYKYHIPKGQSIQNPSEDSRIQKLFQDQEFLKVMEQQRDEKRMLLYAYLKQNGWRQYEKDKIGIVDIGWKGTIQDNLCFLYPDYKIFGFYAGLQDFLIKQPPNSRKYGYMNIFRYKGLILSSVRPLEMLCNSKNGSTEGYIYKEGFVKAVKVADKEENDVYSLYTKKMQGIIINDKNKCLNEMVHSKDADYRKKAMKALFQFIAYPDYKSASAYFELKHNEVFGLGKYVQVKEKFSPYIFFYVLFGSRGIRKCQKLLSETGWPQGYIAKLGFYPILPIYNLLLTCYLERRKGNGTLSI